MYPPVVQPPVMAPPMVPAEPPAEEVGYEDQPPERIDPYTINYDENFICDANYSQKVICEIGDELSYTDAVKKAIELCEQENAHAFFYQCH